MKNRNTFIIGFEDQVVEISYNDHLLKELIHYLFKDLIVDTSSKSSTHYVLHLEKDKQWLSLWDRQDRKYRGQSLYKLSYHLMTEVMYRCILGNRRHHAIHAGAVYSEKQCLILPGTSGKGKSTLTAWLLTKGFHYLTDELVLILNDGHVTPFTRPINLKTRLPFLSSMLQQHQDQIISDTDGVMIPHRLLNPHHNLGKNSVTHFIFPNFQNESKTELVEISPLKSCFLLMQSHVNARSLSGLGVSSLSSVVKKCQSFKLNYGCIDGLEQIFSSELLIGAPVSSTNG